MRLRSGVAQNRRPLRQDAGHDRVFSSGDARFVEQDIRAGQPLLNFEMIAAIVVGVNAVHAYKEYGRNQYSRRRRRQKGF